MRWKIWSGAALFALAAAVLLEARIASAKPSNPFEAAVLPEGQTFTVDGQVVERVLAGSYVYLKVALPRGAGERWAVSLAATASQEPRVRMHVVGRSPRFHSARLDRDFDDLWFAVVRAAPPDAPQGESP